MKNLNFWFCFSFCLSFLVIVPIAVIFYSALNVNKEIWGHIYEYLFFQYSTISIFLVIGVSILTFVFGTTSAWIMSFYDLPFKRLLSFLLIMPIAIPPYAVAYCYADISDYYAKIQNFEKFDYLTYFVSLIPSVRSTFGAIFVLSLTLFPYVYLICKNSFINNSKSILEAAANLGASRRTLFFKFALPISRPAIAAAIALVTMETLADFGVVHYLGVDSLSVGIYKAWFSFDDLNSSARIASILFTFSFLIIFLEKLSRKKKSQRYISYGKINNYNLFPKGSFLPGIFILLLISISLIIPLSWLIACIVSSDRIFIANLINPTFNSLKLGFFGAAVIVCCALIICFYKRISSNTFSFIFSLAKIGYASPGIVIAIGVFVPIVFLDKKISLFFSYFGYELGLIMSSSIFILIMAYLVRFLSVAINPIEASYDKISEKIDFVARNLSATNKRLFFDIHVPMIFVSIVIAFLLLFIDIIKELPATLILRPLNFNTLSITTFELASSEQLSMAATPALLITCLAIIPLILIHFLFNKIDGEV